PITKSVGACTAPTGKCSLTKEVRSLTSLVEGYLTRGARRRSWKSEKQHQMALDCRLLETYYPVLKEQFFQLYTVWWR
ncbi:hypothetical protein QYG89_17165, partial [Bacillus sp. B190/17]